MSPVSALAPRDIAPLSNRVKMGIRVLDESLPVDRQSLCFETRSLFFGSCRRHVRAYSAFCADNAMPRNRGRFFVGHPAKHEGDVTGNDVHMNSNAAVSGESTLRNQHHEPKYFNAYACKGYRLAH